MSYADKSGVQAMFGRIARRYDWMNRLMTFGQDRGWRRVVVKKAHISNTSCVLDIAAGTGDIAFEVRSQFPEAEVVAADFALPMMQVGQKRPLGNRIDWSAADAMALPFADEAFDAVVSGFLLRNVPQIDVALQEQYRILKSGGWIVSLDTSPPPATILRPFINLYLRYFVPMLGRLVTGEASAYRYLSGSTLAFEAPEDLAARFEKAGFVEVGYERKMLGTIGIHWGKKI